MSNWMNQYNFKAGTLAVMRNHKLVYSRGFGWQDKELATPIHPDAVMRVASIGKPIEAAAIRKLVADGLLSLDAKVYDLLQVPPSGPLGDPHHLQYTVGDLLNNTSGVTPSPPITYEVSQALGLSRPATADEIIGYMWTKPLGSTPGTYNYANWGYELLGAVIEKVSGMPWGQYINSQVAAPARAFTITNGPPNGDSFREIWYHGDQLIRQEKDVLNNLPRVPVPYAWDTENRFGCVISSSPDLCRFFNRYFGDGNPRGNTTGWVWVWDFYGSLPGVWAVFSERITPTNGQFSFALILNRRLETDGQPFGDLVDGIRSHLESIQTWPSQNLDAMITGNNVPILPGTTTPSLADGTEFGSESTGGATVTRVFKILNLDSIPVNLTGSPAVAITGTHAADFIVSTPPATPLSGNGGTTTFAITFAPSAAGLRQATVTLTTDHPLYPEYTFAIQGSGVEYTVALTPVVRIVPAAGGDFEVEVRNGGPWNWLPSGNSSWLSGSEPSHQTGDQTFSYHVAANTSASRLGWFSFVHQEQVRRHAVFQESGATRSSGDVVAWGQNDHGQTTVPQGLSHTVSVACGQWHTVALKRDGTVTAWGHNLYGQSDVPAELSGVKAVAAGSYHSLALKEDGTVVAWGLNGNGQTTVPAGLTRIVAIAAGRAHSLALRDDGAIIAWGWNSNGQTTVPANLEGVIGIAAGNLHSVALLYDGTVVAWGSNANGQCNVPANLGGVTQIAAGYDHTLALKSNGTVVAWGWNGHSESTVPVDATGISRIAAGFHHSLALKADGSVVMWGSNSSGQRNIPAGLSGVIDIAGGGGQTVAVKHVPVTLTVDPTSRIVPTTGGTFAFQVMTIDSWSWDMTGGEGWVSTTEPTDQMGDQTFTYTLSPHTGLEDRSAKITISANGLVRTHTITQSAPIIPEVEIKGNGVEIPNESWVPDLQNHTDFGTVGITGASVRRTFTIINHGKGALFLTGAPKVAITGSHAADFNIISMPQVASLATGTLVDFIIRFDPSEPGLRTATVTVMNNDADEGAYAFAIQGTGADAGGVSFDQPLYVVNQGAAQIPVTLARTGSTHAFSVRLQLETVAASILPPFASAQPGVDYQNLVGEAALVNFEEGESSKTILLTLIAKTASSTPNKQFAARLADPQNGLSLGGQATAVVQILAADTNAPTVRLAAPANKAKVSASLPYLIQGIAGDAKGIQRVAVKLNDGVAVDAELGAARSLTSVPFTLAILPIEGVNTLVVTAYDLKGNWKEIIHTFTFTRRHLLTLTRSKPAAGTVMQTATPAAAATALTPAAATANPKKSEVVAGTTLKLIAKPAKGFVFKNWSGLPAGAAAAGDALTFTMPSSDVELEAEFIATPFHAPAGVPNTFHGLLPPEEGTPSSNATEGFITGTLTATGGFTGKLFMDGVVQPIAATFFGDGSCVFTSSGKKLTTLTFGSRKLTLDWENESIKATVVNDSATSSGSARRAQYGTGSKVPPALLDGPTATKGTYTAALLSQIQEPPLPASSYPQGDGFATIRLSITGTAALAATLADGTKATGAFVIAGNNAAPFLFQLSTPGATAVKGGSVSGTLAFHPTPADTDVTATLLWFRPASAKANVILYNTGWPDGIRLPLIGARYQSKTSVQTALALASPTPEGNAQLLFSHGKLDQPILKTNFNVVANTFTKEPKSDSSFTLTLTGSSGAISGTFVPNWANPAPAKPSFKGIILQKGANKGGYGFFISNAKNDTAPESGRVELHAP